MGIAILAVVLQRALVHNPHTVAGAASAYGTAFSASAVLTALAIVPCVVLMRAERAARAGRSAPSALGGEAIAEALA
jgi:hypothetical protein